MQLSHELAVVIAYRYDDPQQSMFKNHWQAARNLRIASHYAEKVDLGRMTLSFALDRATHDIGELRDGQFKGGRTHDGKEPGKRSSRHF